MKNKTLLVYTGVDLNMMIAEGGSGYWKLGASSLQKVEYLIACKNYTKDWAVSDKNIPQGTAFFIAKVAGFQKMLDGQYEDRYLITFSEYAEIRIPKAWQKICIRGLPAARYFTTNDVLADLVIEPSKLAWKSFIPAKNTSPQR